MRRDYENKRARPIFIRSFQQPGWKVHPNKNWYAFTQGIAGRLSRLLARAGQKRLIGQVRAMLGQTAAGSADEKESGKSDLFVDANGKFLYVEIKWFEGTITFNEWRDNQRDWLNRYATPSNYYIATMVEPTRKAKRTRVSEAEYFLVPADKWLEINKEHKSMPLTSNLGRGEVNAMDVWKDYRLSVKNLTLKSGFLEISKTHPIWS